MHRSFFGSRLIPRIASAVREGRASRDDDATIDEAVDQAIKHHAGNPILSEKLQGRRDFVDHAEDLLEHRTTLQGFYLPHAHDEQHNNCVKQADELFPYETSHTRKNGYVSGIARSEFVVVGGVSAASTISVGGLGYSLPAMFEAGELPPAIWGIGCAISGGLTAAFSRVPMNLVNRRYRAVGEQADTVWDAYVEDRDYDADLDKPTLPFRYINASMCREPKTSSLTSSKP